MPALPEKQGPDPFAGVPGLFCFKNRAIAMNEENRLLSVKDCAKILGVSEATVWRRVRDRSLPEPIGLGRLRRWPKSAILDFIAGRGGGRPAVATEADPAPITPMDRPCEAAPRPRRHSRG